MIPSPVVLGSKKTSGKCVIKGEHPGKKERGLGGGGKSPVTRWMPSLSEGVRRR